MQALEQGLVRFSFEQELHALTQRALRAMIAARTPNMPLENVTNIVLKHDGLHFNTTTALNLVLKGVPQCVWWDYGVDGWSSRGCRLVPLTRTGDAVRCECNHLTSFGLLLSVNQQGQLSSSTLRALRAIVYVGSGLALFGLLITGVCFAAVSSNKAYR